MMAASGGSLRSAVADCLDHHRDHFVQQLAVVLRVPLYSREGCSRRRDSPNSSMPTALRSTVENRLVFPGLMGLFGAAGRRSVFATLAHESAIPPD
jgi:hypothetical protein